jgi:ATP-dependent Clp protease ATP-binding subunit ClpA
MNSNGNFYVLFFSATTLDEYKKHIEKDPGLERRFQPVKIPEPLVDETIEILRGF